MNIRITEEQITELKPNEIFVFGSNLSGRHGRGAAKTALDKFGAIWGQANGLQGESYGISTKTADIRATLTVEQIQVHAKEFIGFAKVNPHLTFLVTEIGCGLAGLTPKQVAPLFKDAIRVKNIHLPLRFWRELTPFRYEFSKIKLDEWESYTVTDLFLMKIVCHLLPYAGEEYCERHGKTMVKSLNELQEIN